MRLLTLLTLIGILSGCAKKQPTSQPLYGSDVAMGWVMRAQSTPIQITHYRYSCPQGFALAEINRHSYVAGDMSDQYNTVVNSYVQAEQNEQRSDIYCLNTSKIPEFK